MAPKSGKSSGNGSVKVHVTWTNADDTILVRILKEQKDAGNQSGTGWKRIVWTMAEAALKAENPDPPKTFQKCGQMCVFFFLFENCS